MKSYATNLSYHLLRNVKIFIKHHARIGLKCAWNLNIDVGLSALETVWNIDNVISKFVFP